MAIEDDIRRRYREGTPPDVLAREYSLAWADVARICGHLWRRPADVDKMGMPKHPEDDLTYRAPVVGID